MSEILIVDDHDNIREIFSMLVRSMGHIPIVARDGENALRKLETRDFRIDLIITDISMPNMGGSEFVEKLKSRININHIPVILMSGCVSEIELSNLMHQIKALYLSKPVHLKDLRENINKSLCA